MNTLESPVEALALNYLTCGLLTAVNSIWAWVTVITAAVSFWRIRALSPSEPRGGSHRDDAASTSTSSSGPPLDAAETTLFSATAEKLSCPDREVSIEAKFVTGSLFEGSADSAKTKFCSKEVSIEAKSVTGYCTKAKFTLYYDQDYRDNNNNNNNSNNRLWADDWDRVMVVRVGDMGWYRWQDRAVFDGSVVRLWDGCRSRRAAEELVVGGSW